MAGSKTKARQQKTQTFEQYVKKHGEDEAVPFDDVLRRLVDSPPKRKKERRNNKQKVKSGCEHG